jgi:hypothetical protein
VPASQSAAWSNRIVTVAPDAAREPARTAPVRFVDGVQESGRGELLEGPIAGEGSGRGVVQPVGKSVNEFMW